MTGVKYDGTRQLHDLLVDLLLKWLRRAKIPHMRGFGSFERTCNGLITEFANQLPEPSPENPAHAAALLHRQGIIHDFMLDVASINFPENLAA